VADDDVAGHLHEEGSELGYELAEREERARVAVRPGARERVPVVEAVLGDREPGERRAPRRRAPGRAPEKRRGRGGAEDIGERLPQGREEPCGREVGARRAFGRLFALR
jgi:hypothetical protein